MTYFKDGKVIGISETQTASDNSTKIATTAYADNAAYNARSQELAALEIDWSAAEIFYKNLDANSNLTFANLPTAKTILVIIRNIAETTITVTFPISVLKDTAHTGTISPGYDAVYTLIRNNSRVYLVESANLF